MVTQSFKELKKLLADSTEKLTKILDASWQADDCLLWYPITIVDLELALQLQRVYGGIVMIEDKTVQGTPDADTIRYYRE